MGKPHPIELRDRVVAYVDEGHSHRAAARHFRVSPRFVNNMIKLRRESGNLVPKEQGHHGNWNKLSPFGDWARQRFDEKPELTLDELRLELLQVHKLEVHLSSVWHWVHRLGLSHKKNSAGPRTTPS